MEHDNNVDLLGQKFECVRPEGATLSSHDDIIVNDQQKRAGSEEKYITKDSGNELDSEKTSRQLKKFKASASEKVSISNKDSIVSSDFNCQNYVSTAEGLNEIQKSIEKLEPTKEEIEGKVIDFIQGENPSLVEKQVGTVDDKAKDEGLELKEVQIQDLYDKGFTDEPSYFFEKGLRKVKPYYHIYETNAKGRWFGRTILDVFTTEFQDQPPHYYKAAIQSGKIRVDKNKVGLDYILKNKNRVFHLIHRHEPPILDQPIEIVHKSESMVVVNKPAGMPVHPSGRYRYNTLLYILQLEYGIKKFNPANRLDRLTSGIVLIGQYPQVSRELEYLMRNEKLTKSYLARVSGNFPDDEIVCNQPIKTYSHKLALNLVDKDGKQCQTTFKKIDFDGTTSLIRCYPKTGRTHQIRVHLLHLGFPIANDPLYILPENYDPSKEYGELTQLQHLKHSAEKRLKHMERDLSANNDIGCSVCGAIIPEDPEPEQRILFLHAENYAGPDWDYKTKLLPSWATSNS